MKIGISACLLGYEVRYDGRSQKNTEILKLVEGNEIIPLCPELAAGFLIPRTPMEISNDQVYDRNGNDQSEKLTKGSLMTYEKIKDCDFLILKSKSPSCGYGMIYDGSFSGKLCEGNGVFAQIALKNNLKIFSENDLSGISRYLGR